MKRYLCIHCHFYQPARENPWLEAIEIQDSADPYHDWNERITAECYAPNAAARILNDSGRIVKILNNYSRISFNFGPTLLSWLEAEAPETYQAILRADRESAERFSGHGSAIAQTYNHMILPLANRRDKQTQVSWGIADFRRRFGRLPEGMWLPETGVDLESLEALAAQGIAFTILAPGQAGRVRESAEQPWQDVSGGRIDPTRPYRANLPSGASITIFFYDGPVSRAVAFERLLTRGEDFARRLKDGYSSHRRGPQLMHIATDGETYGHHHRHGDMALAYALERLDEDPTVQLTNYGEYLELHPPTWEVEILQNTSWSCAHGVERWRSDCGCGNGENGWNQRWRGALRTAMDWLRDAVESPFQAAASRLVIDPWRARSDYIAVVNDRSDGSLQEFLRVHATRDLDADERLSLLRLLEMQRSAMLMYTSCGWFFDDISGIETIQVLQYAARTIQLGEEILGRSLEAEFLRSLDKAKSNVPGVGSGRDVYLNQVRPAMVDLPRVGAHFAVSSLFEEHPQHSRVYCYDVFRESHEVLDAGRAKVVIGRSRVESRITRESMRLTYGVLYLGDLSISGGVREFRGEDEFDALSGELSEPLGRHDFATVIRALDRHFGSLSFSMNSLFRDEQRRILGWIWDSTIGETEATYKRLYEQHRSLMLYQSDLSLPLPKIFLLTAEVALNLSLRRAAEQDEPPVGLIQRLINEAMRANVPLDQSSLSFAFRKMVEEKAEALEFQPDKLALLDKLDSAVSLVSSLPFEVPLWKVQNSYERLRDTILPRFLEERTNDDKRIWVDRFVLLGEKLSFGSTR